jgi:DNA-binding MarR family transcriptional regulator
MLLCLLYLSPGGGLSQQQIARSLNVTNSNITQLIDALVRDGWIERSVDNADRRVRNAQLTMSGRQRCADLVHDVLDFIDTSAARRR